MSETPSSDRKLKRFGAGLAGVLVGVGFTLGTDAALHKTGIFPALGQRMSNELFALATAYRLVYSVLGSYVAARLVTDRPMQIAMILGGIGSVVSVVGAVVTWNMDLGPHWYPLALVVTAIPCAWVGGKIRELQLQSNKTPAGSESGRA